MKFGQANSEHKLEIPVCDQDPWRYLNSIGSLSRVLTKIKIMPQSEYSHDIPF